MKFGCTVDVVFILKNCKRFIKHDLGSFMFS